jgi:outer membrane immunogenic protein
MSRIKFLGASLIAIIAGGSAAAAADLGNYQPPPVASYTNPAPVFSWGGAYIGLQGGYAWNHVDDGTVPYTANGWMGGLYGGYNFQAANNFVLGVEGDANLKEATGSGSFSSYDNPWDASLRLRAGFAVDRFLIYGAGGVSVGRIDVSDGINSDSATKVGWNVAAGVEAAITGNLVGRVELRHTDLGSATYANTGLTVDSSSNALLAGVGIKF